MAKRVSVAIDTATGEMNDLSTPALPDCKFACPDCLSEVVPAGATHFEHVQPCACEASLLRTELLAALDRPRCDPVNLAMPELLVEVTTDQLSAVVSWHKPAPPATILKSQIGPDFYVRFTTSSSNNLALILSEDGLDWISDHAKRYPQVGILAVDYPALQAELAAVGEDVDKPNQETLSAMFIATAGAKRWLYHPRAAALRERKLAELLAQAKPQTEPQDQCPPETQTVQRTPTPVMPVHQPLPITPPSGKPAPAFIQESEQDQPQLRLYSPEALARRIERDGQYCDDQSVVLYNPQYCVSISAGWIVLMHERVWFVSDDCSGDWRQRAVRFSGGLRKAWSLPVTPDFEASVMAAAGYCIKGGQ